MSNRANQSDLEARYRLLMRAYPASYRAHREDEIVGVLMDRARPGQDRPTFGDAYDLATAGLVRRFSLRPEAVAPSTWSDSLSIVAVLFVMLRAFGAVVVPIAAISMRPAAVPLELAWRIVNLPAIIGWTVVAGLIWMRKSTIAGVCAAATTVTGIAYHFLIVYGATDDFFDSLHDQTSYLALSLLSIAVSILLLRRGAGERGLERLGRANVLLGALGYAGLVLAVTALTHDTVWAARAGPELLGLSNQALVVIPLLAVASRRIALRPIAALLAAIASLQVVSASTFFYASNYGPRPWLYAVELLALLVVPVAVARFVLARDKQNTPTVAAL